MQRYEKGVNTQRKRRKNLEVTGKMPIFATSKLSFGYPGRIPSWGRTISPPSRLKSCLGNSLFIIPPAESIEKVFALRGTPF
jgi:hypothetical protein